MNNNRVHLMLILQELQIDKTNKKRNYSARIIREKERLLREKEETIRQQANLIKTQSQLLYQRKRMNISNVLSLYDKIFELHGINSTNPTLPTTQGQLNKIIKMLCPTYFTNPQSNRSSAGNPFQHHTNNSAVSVPQPRSRYALHISSHNLPEYRRNNIEKDECRRDNRKDLTNQLLEELEKQTVHEIQKLNNNCRNDNSSGDEHVNVIKNLGATRKSKQVKWFQSIFECRACSITWKCKTPSVGNYQKCRKCGTDVGSVSETVQMMKQKCENIFISENHGKERLEVMTKIKAEIHHRNSKFNFKLSKLKNQLNKFFFKWAGHEYII